eukprot:4193250-Pleurochrysis_carterae.AAC.3
MACFSKYAGVRKAYVLPYNAQANGMAKQSVGRITRLLVTQAHSAAVRELAIDTTNGTSPFFALYGRRPTFLPKLENTHLFEVTEIGHEFVDSLALRLRQALSAVRDISMPILAVAAAKTESHYKDGYNRTPWIMSEIYRLEIKYFYDWR